MKLRLRHLRLRATTSEGPYGTDLAFGDGLVVVRGRNTSGKSTAMKAILYALGLEGMLGPSKVPPFPEAMTKRLQGRNGEVDVLESHVALQIQNEAGRVIVCTRVVVGAKDADDIVQVIDGPALTEPANTYASRGYYVRLPGAATHESGFHTFLAEFIGWELPMVPRFDGDPGPLYMECVFPFLFVEQLTGWRGIYARMPTFLGIPEVWNRSVEFLLRLDRSDVPLRRFLLDRKRGDLQTRWKSAVEQARLDVRGLGVMPKGLPAEPTATWPPEVLPGLVVVAGDVWTPGEIALQEARERLKALDEREIPQVQDVASQLAQELAETERRLSSVERQQASLTMEIRAEEEDLASLNTRLTALEEDLRKNQDELTLRKRGAVGDRALLSSDCPVCKRPRTDSLLAQDIDITPMPIEANIAYVKAEIGLFSDLRSEQENVIEAKTQRMEALQQSVADLHALLREQRRSLRADGQIPSTAAIRERMQAEDRVTRLEAAARRFDELLVVFATLADAWRANESERRVLKDGSTSANDEVKRALIESSFKEQLIEYGFSSYGPDTFKDIRIDQTTFRPVKDGFDLGEMSASDTIRCVWAYLLALLETARSTTTNHPGLLLLDEPRQQSASGMSFTALIKRASAAGTHGQQVIFATSEERPDILQAMRKSGALVLEIPQKILQPL